MDTRVEEKIEKLEKKISEKIEMVEKLEAKKSKLAKSERVSKFADKLSQLRKERGISQKKAASDLGISQALLSHYEKGIRECGLDFVIRCGEYYGVSTDYLLGVSESRNGLDIHELSTASGDEFSLATLGQATKLLIDIASSAGDDKFLNYIYDYYVLSVYRGALTMAKTGLLPREMFKLDYTLAKELCSAAIAVEDSKFALIEDKSRTGTDLIEKTALHLLIDKAEEHILNNFIID